MESEEQGSASVRSPLSSEGACSNVVRGAPTESGELFKYLDMSRRYKGARGPCTFFRPGLQRRPESGPILDCLGAPRCTSCWPRFLWHLYICIRMQLLLLQQDRECGEWSMKGKRKEPECEAAGQQALQCHHVASGGTAWSIFCCSDPRQDSRHTYTNLHLSIIGQLVYYLPLSLTGQ